MDDFDGRVAIVTGAGRGLGREHARLLAARGAHVVVNDLGVTSRGDGADRGPADRVVAEILDEGGRATANYEDVGSWEGARRLVASTVDEIGDLDIVVNNAGVLRDSMLVNLTENDFDAVTRVHLKGHVAMTRWAASHWRDRHKRGDRRRRNLVHTSSTSGIYANPGQSNYGPAKSGIVTLSQIAAKELASYGVRSNCVIPGARTRLTLSSPGLPEIMEAPAEGFDPWSPANAAPLVAYLAATSCPFSGATFYVQGGTIRRLESWTLVGDSIESADGWELAELGRAMEAFRTPGPVTR